MRGPKTVVSLRQPVYTTTSTGSRTADWRPIKTFRGILQPLTSKERLAFDKDTTFYTHRLTVPYNAIGSDDIDEIENAENVIRRGSTDFQIKGIIPHIDGRLKHWEIELLEVK